MVALVVGLRGMSGITIISTHHDKTNEVACAPSKDSNQPGHPG